GNGEMTGTHWINDAGYSVGPVCITNTHSVGKVHHGATRWMIDTYADYFRVEHAWAMPVVAETYDSVLNDINGQHVDASHATDAPLSPFSLRQMANISEALSLRFAPEIDFVASAQCSILCTCRVLCLQLRRTQKFEFVALAQL
ncbi:MAG: P1 family peptidase, partial [Hyphomicrobiales bacterium]